MSGASLDTVIVTVAPAEPAEPDTETPVVYSTPPELSFVVLNFRGCVEFDVSDWSNIYVSPLKNANVGIISPSI